MSTIDISLDDMQRGALIEWFEPFQAKDLARWFDVEPRTAHSWKQGALPQKNVQQRMVQRWGLLFLIKIWGPIAELSNEQNALIQLEVAKLAIMQAEKGAAAYARQKVNSRDSEHFSAPRTEAGKSGLMDFIQGLTASAVVALGLLAAFSTIPIHHDDDMGRVRTARARVVRFKEVVV